MKRSRIKPVSAKRAAANKVSTLRPSRKPIAHRSVKMQAKYDGPDGRKALVARLLAERPRCEFRGATVVTVEILSTSMLSPFEQADRQIKARYNELNKTGWPQCDQPSTEIHERLSRARGGSILDESNCVALCHEHHRWTTDHPAEATKLGLLKSRWGKHEE